MKRIVFFDLEGILTEGECWNNIKDKFWVGDFVEEYLALYEEGKIGYEEWRMKLAKIWKENKNTKQQFKIC